MNLSRYNLDRYTLAPKNATNSSPSPFLLFAHNYVTLSVSKRTISQDGTSAAKHTKAVVKPYEANKSPR